MSVVETLTKAALLKRQDSEISKLKAQLADQGCAAACKALRHSRSLHQSLARFAAKPLRCLQGKQCCML